MGHPPLWGPGAHFGAYFLPGFNKLDLSQIGSQFGGLKTREAQFPIKSWYYEAQFSFVGSSKFGEEEIEEEPKKPESEDKEKGAVMTPSRIL